MLKSAGSSRRPSFSISNASYRMSPDATVHSLEPFAWQQAAILDKLNKDIALGKIETV